MEEFHPLGSSFFLGRLATPKVREAPRLPPRVLPLWVNWLFVQVQFWFTGLYPVSKVKALLRSPVAPEGWSAVRATLLG